MAICTRAEAKKGKDGKRIVIYHYDDGSTVIRSGGDRAWRNNNPGNLIGGQHGEVGRDREHGGLAIFPDVSIGADRRSALFEAGGKYYGYDSIRQALWGLFDKENRQINGTGYDPRWDENGKVINNPAGYADFVRQYFRDWYQSKYNTDMDIEQIRIRDYTPEMLDVLEAAQKAKEGNGRGETYRYDAQGRLTTGSLGGSLPDHMASSPEQPLRTVREATSPPAAGLPHPRNLLGPVDAWSPGAAAPVDGRNRLLPDAAQGNASPYVPPYGDAYADMARRIAPARAPFVPGDAFDLPPFSQPSRPRNLLEAPSYDVPFGGFDPWQRW